MSGIKILHGLADDIVNDTLSLFSNQSRLPLTTPVTDGSLFTATTNASLQLMNTSMQMNATGGFGTSASDWVHCQYNILLLGMLLLVAYLFFKWFQRI